MQLHLKWVCLIAANYMTGLFFSLGIIKLLVFHFSGVSLLISLMSDFQELCEFDTTCKILYISVPIIALIPNSAREPKQCSLKCVPKVPAQVSGCGSQVRCHRCQMSW
jgi:hypothetical protein